MFKEEQISIHAANEAALQNDRVWICEACERAPAAFICKADAASLCTTCDADIHSANPLASRHHRVPVAPIPGCVYGPQAAKGSILGLGTQIDNGYLTPETDEVIADDDDESEAASWLLIHPAKDNPQQITNGLLFGGEAVDEYLDFVDFNSCQDNQFATQQQYDVPQKAYGEQYNEQQKYYVPQKSYAGDSVVPVQNQQMKTHQFQPPQQAQPKQNQNFQLDVEYETSNPGYCYPTSLSHSVSVSSMDVGVVPESTMMDISATHPRPSKGTIDLFSSQPVQMPTPLTPLDREARVLRYREKKKTRKFEKTIRYASRKAYAETRPRIKGRFAKRADADTEVDQMFSSTLMAETGYGIVPSF